MMSSLTDRICQNAITALMKRDTGLCDHVIADDEEVDVLEKQIDEEGVRRRRLSFIQHELNCCCRGLMGSFDGWPKLRER
jgi:phosphate uptake regulator